jgi:hypothetical protein
MASTKVFNVHTPTKIPIELEPMEAYIRLEIITASYKDIDVDLTAWFLDTWSSFSQETKYYCTIDLYWHIKALMGKFMADMNTYTNEMSLQLEYLQLQIKVVDQKFSLLAENTMGLNFNEPSKGIPHVSEEKVPSPPT